MRMKIEFDNPHQKMNKKSENLLDLPFSLLFSGCLRNV